MSRELDFPKLLFVMNVTAISIAVTTAVILAWQNLGSRNLALATGTLFGAAIGYLIQLWVRETLPCFLSGSIHPVQQQLASSFSNAVPER